MARTERSAEVEWKGTLTGGQGLLWLKSGAAGGLPVTWASRIDRSDGRTSPEELIAAAHASCFSMAFSHGLTQAGTPPEYLHTAAACAAEHGEAGLRVVSVELTVRGKVHGLDAEAFASAAEAAKENCPISQLLKGNAEISVTATLE